MVLTPAVWGEGVEEEEEKGEVEKKKERVEDKSRGGTESRNGGGQVTEKDGGEQRERKRKKNETQNTKREIRGAGWRPSLRSHLEQRLLGVSMGEEEEAS